MATAVVVQCFAKTDTLADLCASLLRMEGHETIRLIFWCDNPAGVSRNAEQYTAGHARMLEFLKIFAVNHVAGFRSVEILLNPTNLGPYRTCQIALDHAFARSEFAIFSEDDVIFSRDALVWFESALALGLLDQPDNWALAGESPFFDAQSRIPSPGYIERMIQHARQEDLGHYYTFHDSVPSTIFATTKTRWREFGETRGQPCGDVEVNKRCQAEGKGSIYPVVPRAKDVGMLHDLGHSVAVHTKAGVTEIKHTYLLAEDIYPAGPLPRLPPQLYAGDKGQLWLRSTLRESATPIA